MRFKLNSLLLCLALNAGNVWALQEPTGSAYDSRLKTVPFNEDDVVKIDTALGVHTLIILDPKEQYITHAFGDPEAWTFGRKLNYVFIKPKEVLGDTNLSIVTDKRVYTFDVRFHEIPYPTDARKTFDKRMTFRVKFRYPEIEAAIAKKKMEEEKIKKQFADVRKSGNNLDYNMNGDLAIAPVNVWDDGLFTKMKWKVGQDVPVIFYVNDDGEETIVGQHSSGRYKDIVVLHRVAKKWHIRLGDKVVGIYNNNFSPVESGTETSSENIIRVLK